MSAQRWALHATGLALCLVAAGACRTVHVQGRPPTTPRAPRENAAIRDLRRIAAEDLGCEPSRIEVSKVGREYGVAGCNKRTIYARRHDGDRRWTRTGTIALRTAPAEPVLVATKSERGQTTLTLKLPHADTDLVLRLVARPAAYPDKALLSFERPLTLSSMAECETLLSVDGAPLALPRGSFRREGLLESRLIELPMRDVGVLARAQRAVAGLCGKQVALVEADFLKLRELVAQVDAELAGASRAMPSGDPASAQIAAPTTAVAPTLEEGVTGSAPP